MMYSNEKPFTLSCCVQGYPKPRITWLKNNKPLPTNRDQYTLQNDNQELTIERLLSRDSGEYTCIAINIHGVSNYTIFMDIRGELKHILVSIGFLWLKPSVKFAVSAIPLFLFTSGDVIIESLEISTKQNTSSPRGIVTLSVEWLLSRESNRVHNRLLEQFAFSMEDKMAAEAFGRARNYGWDGLGFKYYANWKRFGELLKY